jgi:hypothetical protein
MKVTVGLVAALVLPFFVLSSTGDEIVPSVIFPGGGGTVQVKDHRVVFRATTFWAHRPDGDELEQLDPRTFLAPIPVQSSPGVANQLLIAPSSPDSDLSAWIAWRLRSLGYSDAILVVRRTVAGGLLPSGNVTDIEIEIERVIEL